MCRIRNVDVVVVSCVGCAGSDMCGLECDKQFGNFILTEISFARPMLNKNVEIFSI